MTAAVDQRLPMAGAGTVLGIGLIFRDDRVVLLSALTSGLALAWTAALGLGAWHWIAA